MCQSQETHVDLLKQIKIIQEIRRKLPQIIKANIERQKPYYDAKHQDIKFKPGDLVLIRNEKTGSENYSKFRNRYIGPFSVIEQLTPVTYLINRIHYGKLVPQKIHVKNLKIYHRRMPIETPVPQDASIMLEPHRYDD